MEDLLAPLFRKHDPTSNDDPSSKDPPKIEGFEWIRNGTFTMGSSDTADGYAQPPHLVTITKGFYMGKYQVTQEQYEAVTGKSLSDQMALAGQSTSYGVGNNYPIYYVSWYDAIEFCNDLSVREGLTSAYTIDKINPDPNNTNSLDPLKWTITLNPLANGYRLPTEAEWEYACRAGTETAWSFGDNDTIAGDYAWYNANSGSNTHEVGLKLPNDFGLYDMHGNVYEWCWDWYGTYNAGGSLETDPLGASSGSDRLIRGCHWYTPTNGMRSATRNYSLPSYRYDIGFRVVRAQ